MLYTSSLPPTHTHTHTHTPRNCLTIFIFVMMIGIRHTLPSIPLQVNVRNRKSTLPSPIRWRDNRLALLSMQQDQNVFFYLVLLLDKCSSSWWIPMANSMYCQPTTNLDGFMHFRFTLCACPVRHLILIDPFEPTDGELEQNFLNKTILSFHSILTNYTFSIHLVNTWENICLMNKLDWNGYGNSPLLKRIESRTPKP